MSDRPTWIYDGATWADPDDKHVTAANWLAFVKASDQVLRDTIKTTGIAVTVLPRAEPYTDPWYVRTLGRASITFQPGAVVDGIGEDPANFTINTPKPKDLPLGIIELRGIKSHGVGRVAIAITHGHGLIEDCDVSGIHLDGTPGGQNGSGGDTGIFGSHSGGEPKYIWIKRSRVKYRGSHGTYLDGTVVVVEDGEFHSADPNDQNDRSEGFDSFRSMANVFVARRTKFLTTDPNPDVAARRYSSFPLGIVSASRVFLDGITIERTCPPHAGAPTMLGGRCRQSFAGAKEIWVGDGPLPPGAHRIKSRLGWAFFGPFLTDEHGEALNGVYTRNPSFWEPDYWEKVRAAGIDTAEQLMANPHCFQWVLRDCTWINHGPRGVGITAEGTAPVEPKEAHGSMHEPRRTRDTTPRDVAQDDYLPRPKRWAERSVIYNANPTFETDDPTFQRYMVRDAERHVFNRSGAAMLTATGREGVGNGTTARIFEYSSDGVPLWLPEDVALEQMATVFPEINVGRRAENIWRP